MYTLDDELTIAAGTVTVHKKKLHISLAFNQQLLDGGCYRCSFLTGGQVNAEKFV
jgi:hypothetical protein